MHEKSGGNGKFSFRRFRPGLKHQGLKPGLKHQEHKSAEGNSISESVRVVGGELRIDPKILAGGPPDPHLFEVLAREARKKAPRLRRLMRSFESLTKKQLVESLTPVSRGFFKLKSRGGQESDLANLIYLRASDEFFRLSNELRKSGVSHLSEGGLDLLRRRVVGNILIGVEKEIIKKLPLRPRQRMAAFEAVDYYWGKLTLCGERDGKGAVILPSKVAIEIILRGIRDYEAVESRRNRVPSDFVSKWLHCMLTDGQIKALYSLLEHLKAESNNTQYIKLDERVHSSLIQLLSVINSANLMRVLGPKDFEMAFALGEVSNKIRRDVLKNLEGHFNYF